ncbi:MAG: sialate O-acetylesterase [Luteolibacter sp.]|jgi:hypothetical protein
MINLPKNITALCGLSLLATSSLHAADLPKPDGKPADMSKPVQVFLIMGQSNTLEFGKVTDSLKELYPFLADGDGWSTRQDVRNVSVMVGKGVYRNEWMTVEGKGKIGIEMGIGHQLGNAIDAPVMVLKSAIGNRSLGWDLLPPGSPRYTYDGKEQPGYREYPDGDKILPFEPGVSKVISTKGRNKGQEVDPWYAGKQYDDDVANAKKVLEDLAAHYPEATTFEVAGILWWQGDKDMRNPAHFNKYEENLVNLIKALRKDFNAPNAAFVGASLGQTHEDDTTSGHGVIMQALKNVASGKYASELGNNIGFVYTHPLSKGGSSSGHYSGNAETYMNVGLAMGEEMVKQLKAK